MKKSVIVLLTLLLIMPSLVMAKKTGPVKMPVWKYDNEQMIIDFHPGQELCAKGTNMFDAKTSAKNGTDLGQAIFHELFKIYGVRNIVMVQFQIGVSKWPLFSWNTIETQIMQAIESAIKAHTKKK